MLDERQFEDLREIFPTLVLFGDPAQSWPRWATRARFDKLSEAEGS